MGDLKPLHEYIRTIEKNLAMGDATEHTHRPALKIMVESLQQGITATNEPRHIECGAPDFILRKGAVPVGYIEAKDVGRSLDEAEKTDQLKRYRASLPSLILTNYLEFRWYVEGECRLAACLGASIGDGKIRRDSDGIKSVVALLQSFLEHRVRVLASPRDLALCMARMAQMIRNLIIGSFEKESENGSLHAQLQAFRENLIPDLSVEYFTDMYAQTIVYGLFAAKCTHPEERFTRQSAAYFLPKTNPFLRKLFTNIAGPDLDDRIAWLVDDLAQVLDKADMDAILKDFGQRTAKEDPVVHFYETFLAAYDPKVREMRGVYYTPEPVVSYIVRSIDHILKTGFNKSQGLADPSVLILDPAVGTATFLYTVINEIHQATVSRGQQGMWNNYAEDKLLPRVFGFELLMAPYAVAHLKLGLLLQETGYKFNSDQRLGIYLTNTLEEGVKRGETLFARWITEEANAAASVKKDEPVMVVLGNPPYSVSSVNKSGYIERLMEGYKTAVRSERNIQPLSDDYIKFIRFAHDRIEHTGHGIVGMITNNCYLSGLIHRGMREELMKAFDEVFVLNLHGNAMLGEKTIDGSPDRNVFDIRQGVAIIFLVRRPIHKKCDQVHYYELWGARETKYEYLSKNHIGNTVWQILNPTLPYFFFVPANTDFKEEYQEGYGIADVFLIYSSGIKTHRDHLVIDYDNSVLRERITTLRESPMSDGELKEELRLEDTGTWNFTNARETLRCDKDWEKAFAHCLYRPFDIRPIFYHKALIDRGRPEVMRHMLAGENLALISMRQVAQNEPYSHFGVARVIVDNRAFYSNRGIQCLFPLYLYSAEDEMQFDGSKRRPNLNPGFIKTVQDKLGLKFIEGGRGDLEQTFGPEDIFNYTYAIFHSPTYRTRYAEFLKIDFPRLPLTSNKELFKALVAKGADLVSLHLMESSTLSSLITKYPVTGTNTLAKVTYDDRNCRVYTNKTQYFEGVLPEVWELHVGGYQVAHKWLKDRKGRTLTYDELKHYQKVIVALNETIRLMAEIDDLIPEWPLR